MSSDLMAGAVALVALYVLEGVFPYFPGRRGRGKHAVNNILLAGINGVINLAFGVLIIRTMLWTGRHSVGLLNNVAAGSLGRLMMGVILFDLWMYAWHRINHEWRVFWIFHRTHHTDIQMDTTTALRFHPIEILISNILNLGIFILLGLNINELVFYKMIMLPVILFHHSNINLPESVDRIFRALIVTPNMHRVHHSWERFETDSNYSSVFSFWDRLFWSFRLRQDPLKITLGLDKYREPQWQNIKGLLLTPFRTGSNG
jgi:sterol desaturase/sphingolipid hydroxylase (fatty acid hydroxylase superfamily)